MTEGPNRQKPPKTEQAVYGPEAECDLVMKGGIASGIVYPMAFSKIAKDFRLIHIGGSSAGAIAAVFAAAAEYRRQTHGDFLGFEQSEAIAEELQKNLSSLFQPVRGLKRPFALFRWMTQKPDWSPLLIWIMTAVFLVYWPWIIVFSVVTIEILHNILTPFTWRDALTTCGVTVLVLIILATVEIVLTLRYKLPRNNFGLCTGIRQKDCKPDGLTDWMAANIERVAYGESGESYELSTPLTHGMIAKKGLSVSVMTTDLTDGRPYRLPFAETEEFLIRKSEMNILFPDWVVTALCQKNVKNLDISGPKDFYVLPVGEHMPLVVMARLSLSFPGLFSTFPLWRRGHASKDNPDCTTPVQHHFSDGGLSSNFPIHLFDAPLPNRPTFGIKFETYNKDLHKGHKVVLPEVSGSAADRLPRKFETVTSFILGMFFAAKDWKDNLQTRLQGYPERIVDVRLNKKQGGFNLWMKAREIAEMQQYGAEAGEKLVTAFSGPNSRFDQHRMNRALAFVPTLERMLFKFAYTFDKGATATSACYRSVITNPELQSNTAKPVPPGVMLPLMNELARIGANPPLYSATNAPTPLEKILGEVDAEVRLNATSGRPRP